MSERTDYRTTVVLLPATPLGLLGPRWHVEHWCTADGCREQVTTEDLIAHAQQHATVSKR